MLYLEAVMIDVIKFIRNSVEMSQQEFADELRIAFATVNRWENGKNNASTISAKSYLSILY